eukprot:SAG31_NODE_6964_length_1832_cov_1.891518_2_plen_155_part_00
MVAGISSAIAAAMAQRCAVATNRSQTHDSDRRWWWIDALLFMALPTFARVSNLISPHHSASSAAEANAILILDAARTQYNAPARGVNISGARNSTGSDFCVGFGEFLLHAGSEIVFPLRSREGGKPDQVLIARAHTHFSLYGLHLSRGENLCCP